VVIKLSFPFLKILPFCTNLAFLHSYCLLPFCFDINVSSYKTCFQVLNQLLEVLPLQPFWWSFACGFRNLRRCGSTLRDFFYGQPLKSVGRRSRQCSGCFWSGWSKYLSYVCGYSLKFLQSVKQSLLQCLDVVY